MKDPLKQKNFRIPQSLDERLKASSKATKFDESDMLRDAVALYLDVQDGEAKRRRDVVLMLSRGAWDRLPKTDIATSNKEIGERRRKKVPAKKASK